MLETFGPWIVGLLALAGTIFGFGRVQRKLGASENQEGHSEQARKEAEHAQDLAERAAAAAPLSDDELQYLLSKHEARSRRPAPAGRAPVRDS